MALLLNQYENGVCYLQKETRRELLVAYQRYLNAFVNEDVDTINECVEFPLTYIGDGVVSTLDSFPISPAEMKAAKGWSTSENFEIDIVAHSETKAHVLMRNCRRLRADGSLIEEASGFYAYKYTADGWKMYAISDIVMPA